MDSRNPANIPSLRKTSTTSKHTKRRLKNLDDIQPALQQVFEKEEGKDMPIPAPPKDVSEAELVMGQVMDEVRKRPKKISEML